MADEKKKDVNLEEDEKFFEDLLGDDIEEDINENDDDKKNDGDDDENDRSQKNRDAEEARKRREAEAKAKAEEEERLKKEKEEEEARKEKEKADAKKKTDQTSKLGEQLVDFKKKYPDVDLQTLDNDKSFKRFIDGKLLGKKDFTVLYEEYLDMRSELSGKSQDEVKRNYERKANSGSGTATPRGDGNPTDVYSEEELAKITAKLPLMSDAEAERIMPKFDKSVEYYKKNK